MRKRKGLKSPSHKVDWMWDEMAVRYINEAIKVSVKGVGDKAGSEVEVLGVVGKKE